jgi:restriction endonuclease-like protein/putative AbiEi antitoxin of type IV toxin-antitoxin system
MRAELATDVVIGALADAQHGVVARRQLASLGLTEAAITRRVDGGRLRPLHRGVFAFGHQALRVEGRWMAAVLACGDRAVLSHASAAAAWDLWQTGSGSVHVTVPGDSGRARREGVRVHRSRTLAPAHITTYRGIPITTRERTIIDLANRLEGRRLEQLLNRAERQLDFDELRRARSPSLQAVLSSYSVATTRSELEEAFLRLCDDHGFPRPEVNARIEGIEVDFVWRDARLIVEVDGYSYHRSPSAFERDRERDAILTTSGWRVLRFTYAQVTYRPAWVAAVALRARTPPGT